MPKRKNKKRKGSKLGSVHHGIAIFYYLLMIISTVSLIIYFMYVRTILDPLLNQIGNVTLP